MDSKNKVSNVRKTFTRCGAVLGTLVTIGATAAPIVTPLIASADTTSSSAPQQVNTINNNGGQATAAGNQNNANGHMGSADAPKFLPSLTFHTDKKLIYFHADKAPANFTKLSHGTNIFYTEAIYSDVGQGNTPSYCIAPWNSSPDGSTGKIAQLLNPTQSSYILQAIYYGYNKENQVGQFGGGVTPEQAYLATQCAIWNGVNTTWGGGNFEPVAGVNGGTNPGAEKAYKYIVGKINPKLTVQQFEDAINKSGAPAQQKLDQIKAQLTQQAQQATQQAIAQKKAQLQKSVSFAVEGLDNSSANSNSSNATSSDSSSNLSSSASSASANSNSASTSSNASKDSNADNSSNSSSTSKKYNSHDDDLNNPDKSFIIHTSADKSMKQDGQTTVVLKNKLPNGTKVVQDGKEIQIADGNTAKPAASDDSSNASSSSSDASNASSASSASANSNSASTSSDSSKAANSSSVASNNQAQSSSDKQSSSTTTDAKLPDGQSSFVVKNNEKFTIELPKDQSYQSDGTAITSDPYHANFSVAPHGGSYDGSVSGTPVQSFETQTYRLDDLPYKNEQGMMLPQQNMIVPYGNQTTPKPQNINVPTVGKGDAEAQPSGDLEMQYKHANNTTTTTGGNTSGGCTSQGGCTTTQGGTGSQGGKTLADTAAGLPGVVMATVASAVASLGAAVALMKKHLFGTNKK